MTGLVIIYVCIAPMCPAVRRHNHFTNTKLSRPITKILKSTDKKAPWGLEVVSSRLMLFCITTKLHRVPNFWPRIVQIPGRKRCFSGRGCIIRFLLALTDLPYSDALSLNIELNVSLRLKVVH